MTSAIAEPGLTVEIVPPEVEPTPLRSDVACFVGRTFRGTVGEPRRIDGWRAYEDHFGGLWIGSNTPYAVRAYFENGGQIAYVIRVLGDAPDVAEGTWAVGTVTPTGAWSSDMPAGIDHERLTVRAIDEGEWGDELTATVRFWRESVGGGPTAELVVARNGETVEHLTGLNSTTLIDDINTRSTRIRVSDPLVDDADARTAEIERARSGDGPRRRTVTTALSNGSDPTPRGLHYRASLRTLLELPEPALLAFPDLHQDLASAGEEAVLEFLGETAAAIDPLRDRMLLVDSPPARTQAAEVGGWAARLAEATADRSARSAALYFPYLEVPDPLGGVHAPRRVVPPCGHLAGLISRLDRERGAHHTPANARLEDAVDLERRLSSEERALLADSRVNVLRCERGVQVWGGRTLHGESPHRYVATRRLLHRLVRAIRRVSEPLVFETNGPEIRLALTAAITTLLFEAYRGGALRGERPDEAFRVVCNESTNPPEVVEQGLLICNVELAPAPPMEQIVLRVALSREGRLEVFQG